MNKQINSRITVHWRNEKPPLVFHNAMGKNSGRSPQASPTVSCVTLIAQCSPCPGARTPQAFSSGLFFFSWFFSSPSLHLAQGLLQSKGRQPEHLPIRRHLDMLREI